MLKKILGGNEGSTHGPDSRKTEISHVEKMTLSHLFLKFDLQKIKKLPKRKQLRRRAEVGIKEIGAINKLLELIYTVTTKRTTEGLRIELRLSDTGAELITNISEYVPTDLLELLEIPLSPNNVHWLLKPGEKVNKAVKISVGALVNYLMQHHNLPTNSVKIPVLANTEVFIHIFGTVHDNIPQSLLFFVNGTGGTPASTLRRRQRQPYMNGALSPA